MNHPKNQEKFPKKLLLEGKDDCSVTRAVCEKLNITESFDLIDCGSKDEIPKKLKAYFLKKKPDIEAIGIVLDADTDFMSRWQSLERQLQDLGYSIAETRKEGVILKGEERQPDIGIWIMPNNTSVGMLEDFVQYLIPIDDQLLTFSKSILDELEKRELNKYKLIHKAKAEIHTWLAWQETPGTPMGLAIKKAYLTTDNELCKFYGKWLDSLFNPSAIN